MRPFLLPLLSLVLAAASVATHLAEDLDAAPLPARLACSPPPAGAEPLPTPAADPEPSPCTLADLRRFPDADATRAAVSSMRAHLDWLDSHLLVTPPCSQEWQRTREVREAVADLLRPWALLHWIRTPTVGPLSALEDLRRMLGEADYRAGRMPGPAWLARMHLQ